MSEQPFGAYEIGVLYEEARRRREEGNASGAFARYRRLLEIADERQELRWKAELHAEVGEMYQRMCELISARHWYDQALALFQGLHDRPSVARIRLRLGEICLVEGALTDAEEHFQAAQSAEAIEVSALATAQLGSLALTQGRETEGLTLLCEAFQRLSAHPSEREAVGRQFERWARDLTPARFRRLLSRTTAGEALRAEIGAYAR